MYEPSASSAAEPERVAEVPVLAVTGPPDVDITGLPVLDVDNRRVHLNLLVLYQFGYSFVIRHMERTSLSLMDICLCSIVADSRN